MDEHLETIIFFERMPGTLHLYEAVRGWICSEFDNVKVRVQKSQISLSKLIGITQPFFEYRP